MGTFKTCPYLYKLQYIDHIKGADNAFSQYGSFVHSLFEMYNKGEKDYYELYDIYVDEYKNKVTLPFPENDFVNLAESYYNAGLVFFKDFSGFKDKTVGAEKKVEFTLKTIDGEDIIVTGIIDRIYETADGYYAIEDYKSKKKFKNKQEQNKYFAQLYLYCTHIINETGDYPTELRLFLFRGVPVTIKFNSDDYNKAIESFVNDVQQIKNTTEFKTNPDKFFCLNLCGVSCIDCPYKDPLFHDD